MGSCFSTAKVSGSNSNTPSTATATNHHQNRRSAAATRQAPATSSSTTAKRQEASHNSNYKTREFSKNQQQKPSQLIIKNPSKRPSGVIPCGKRTDFGYDKDFDNRYSIGKLLGHGQFGYTYVAIDKSNGDRVAVKRIDKSKVIYFPTFPPLFIPFP